MIEHSVHLPDFTNGEHNAQKTKPVFEQLRGHDQKLSSWQSMSIREGDLQNDDQIFGSDNVEETISSGNDGERHSEQKSILQSEHDAVIHDMEQLHKDVVEDLKSNQIDSVREVLEASHSKLVSEVCTHLEMQLISVFSELAHERLNTSAVNSLIGELELMVKKQSVGKLILKGPENLINLVRDALPKLPMEIVLEDSDVVEIVAQLDEKIISTGIQQWAEKLKGMVRNA